MKEFTVIFPDIDFSLQGRANTAFPPMFSRPRLRRSQTARSDGWLLRAPQALHRAGKEKSWEGVFLSHSKTACDTCWREPASRFPPDALKVPGKAGSFSCAG
jgi:hypothetical protein